ncbi:hypothetical protein [Azospirillum endophyticum]
MIAFKFPSRSMGDIVADRIGRTNRMTGRIGGETSSTTRKNGCVVTA